VSQPTSSDSDALIKQIGIALIRSATQGWEQIRTEFRAVGRYYELSAEVVMPDGNVEAWTTSHDIALLFARLRSAMHSAPGGTWFNARYQIERPSKYNLEFDRDEPRWRTPPPMQAFRDELRFFPRAEEDVPDWLMMRLSGLGHEQAARRFRIARIFDAKGPTGRPTVNRPPVPEGDRDRLRQYLDRARLILPVRGNDIDRLSADGRQSVPVAFHSDGVWVWPAAVNYYFARYGLPPEPGLVEHARAQHWQPADVDDATAQAAAANITGGRPAPQTPPQQGPAVSPAGSPATAAETPAATAGGVREAESLAARSAADPEAAPPMSQREDSPADTETSAASSAAGGTGVGAAALGASAVAGAGAVGAASLGRRGPGHDTDDHASEAETEGKGMATDHGGASALDQGLSSGRTHEDAHAREDVHESARDEASALDDHDQDHRHGAGGSAPGGVSDAREGAHDADDADSTGHGASAGVGVAALGAAGLTGAAVGSHQAGDHGSEGAHGAPRDADATSAREGSREGANGAAADEAGAHDSTAHNAAVRDDEHGDGTASAKPVAAESSREEGRGALSDLDDASSTESLRPNDSVTDTDRPETRGSHSRDSTASESPAAEHADTESTASAPIASEPAATRSAAGEHESSDEPSHKDAEESSHEDADQSGHHSTGTGPAAATGLGVAGVGAAALFADSRPDDPVVAPESLHGKEKSPLEDSAHSRDPGHEQEPAFGDNQARSAEPGDAKDRPHEPAGHEPAGHEPAGHEHAAYGSPAATRHGTQPGHDEPMMDRLRDRLRDLGVAPTAYRIGAPAPNSWYLEPVPEGWQVGWYGQDYAKPMLFDDEHDAASFLLGKLVFGTSRPLDTRSPGESSVAAADVRPPSAESPAGGRPESPSHTAGGRPDPSTVGRTPLTADEPVAGKPEPSEPVAGERVASAPELFTHPADDQPATVTHEPVAESPSHSAGGYLAGGLAAGGVAGASAAHLYGRHDEPAVREPAGGEPELFTHAADDQLSSRHSAAREPGGAAAEEASPADPGALNGHAAANPNDLWKQWRLADDPPGELFRNKRVDTLLSGVEVDRYGQADGGLVYVRDTAFEHRSLPQEWAEREVHAYRVTRSVQVLGGTAIPWFDQPGGGSGYLFPRSIEELLADGTLAEITH
jgi:hypothetical protein